MEAPTIQNHDQELASPDMIFEGGATPIQANGKNADFILVPIAVKPGVPAASSAITASATGGTGGGGALGGTGGGTGPGPRSRGNEASSFSQEQELSSSGPRSRAAVRSADVHPAAPEMSSAVPGVASSERAFFVSSSSSAFASSAAPAGAGTVGGQPEPPGEGTVPVHDAAGTAAAASSMLLFWISLAEAAIGARLKTMYAFEAAYEVLPAIALG